VVARSGRRRFASRSLRKRRVFDCRPVRTHAIVKAVDDRPIAGIALERYGRMRRSEAPHQRPRAQPVHDAERNQNAIVTLHDYAAARFLAVVPKCVKQVQRAAFREPTSERVSTQRPKGSAEIIEGDVGAEAVAQQLLRPFLIGGDIKQFSARQGSHSDAQTREFSRISHKLASPSLKFAFRCAPPLPATLYRRRSPGGLINGQ